MDKYGFTFAIDVRGTPYGKITLGLGCFEIRKYNKLLDKFKRNFPEFRRSRNKGCTLKKNKLKDIIEFLNSNKVHMSVLSFKGTDWKYHKDKYGQKGYFKEKIMACLYFMLLLKSSRIKHKYPVTLDHDSWMDIYKAISWCKKLAKANGYDFDFSVGHATQNDLIRIADFIASSYDRIDKKSLEKWKYFKMINSEIPGDYLKKVFS